MHSIKDISTMLYVKVKKEILRLSKYKLNLDKPSRKLSVLPKEEQKRLRALAEKDVHRLMKQYNLSRGEVLRRILSLNESAEE